jgi:DNA-binding NarL/FixJ family response regulator
MDTDPSRVSPKIVVLKWDRLYGDLIRRQILDVWPHAIVAVFQLGIHALQAIQNAPTDLFICGVKIEDMDGLEHLEPFVAATLPILIVTSRADSRTFEMLRELRYDGILDGYSEGLDHLPAALGQVMRHHLYVSPSLLPLLQKRKNITLDALTQREQVVLSVIGDGSDNKTASDRLGISRYTVATHRESIMRKLNLHHVGQLMLYALQHGYVHVTSKGVFYPGFQRRLGGQVPVGARGRGSQKERSKSTAI